MLVIYMGTAFDVYCVLSAAALLLISAVLLRGTSVNKVTAYVGLLAGLDDRSVDSGNARPQPLDGVAGAVGGLHGAHCPTALPAKH